MVTRVGLNRGSLISARNCCLSLTSPSHSVFTNRPDTKASSAGASRFTCASFHRCSSTSNLVSRGSACWAMASQEHSANKKQQHAVRSMIVRVRRHPHVRANSRNIATRRTPQLRKSPEQDYEGHGKPSLEVIRVNRRTSACQNSSLLAFNPPHGLNTTASIALTVWMLSSIKQRLEISTVYASPGRFRRGIVYRSRNP